MTDAGDHVAFGPGDVCSKETRRCKVGAVLFAAKNERWTVDLCHLCAEIQILHRIPKGEGVRFVKCHRPEDLRRKNAKGGILHSESNLWHLMRCTDEGKRTDLFGMFQRVRQRQDAAKRKAAEIKRGVCLRAVAGEGGAKILKARRLAFQESSEIRPQDLRTCRHPGDGRPPACCLMA